MDAELKEFRGEKTKKTFQKVFDSQTISAIHSLAMKKHFRQVEFLVSEGKEALVFRAVDYSERFLAVKAYKITASTFRNMLPYIKGEPRFEKGAKDKRSIVLAWTRKEYSNLELAERAGCRCPLPAAFKNNVLVMEFIGKKGDAAPRLRDAGEIDLESAYEQTTENIARLFYRAKLVHGDLSEYNMLWNNGELVFIDMGQAVSLRHPKAKEFLERDFKNIAKYFNKRGLEKTAEQVREDVKARKEK